MNLIEAGFGRLSEENPELAASVASSLAAIRASWERSKLPEKRLANAARHSIAVFVMSVVSTAFTHCRNSDRALMAMAGLIRHATSIDARPTDRHVKLQSFSVPDAWAGPEGGPWTRDIPGWKLTLVHSPHMPGGSWSISLGSVPCLYGDTAEDVEQATLKMLSDMEAAKRRSMFASNSKTKSMQKALATS